MKSKLTGIRPAIAKESSTFGRYAFRFVAAFSFREPDPARHQPDTRGLALGSALGRLSLAESEAKKRKRKKKKCKGGKKKCGKGCCGAGNACVGGICFCLESDPPAKAQCVDVADILIEIIAEETGIDPDEIGANPDDPLEEHVTIEEDIRQIIDEAIEKKFGVAEEVPYYTEGITAAAEVIREELVQKG